MCAKAYKVLDSQRFCLPQRRNRVWAIAALQTGHQTEEDISLAYISCLENMRSNFQFDLRQNFPSELQECVKPGRHTDHVNRALSNACGRADIFVDCNGSADFSVEGFGVVPCLTRNHAIYSVELQRYLQPEDRMNCQGLWRSTMSPETFDAIVSNPTLTASLTGNSFSSTVCQATFLASLASCSGAWQALRGCQGVKKTHKASSSTTAIQVRLPRVTSKRKAPEYDHVPKPNRVVKRDRKRFKRKVPGKDARAESSKGKKPVSTIWEKEKLLRPQLLRNCVFRLPSVHGVFVLHIIAGASFLS